VRPLRQLTRQEIADDTPLRLGVAAALAFPDKPPESARLYSQADAVPVNDEIHCLSAVRPVPRRGVKAVDRSGNNQGV